MAEAEEAVKFNGKVHPAAAVFPMWSDQELNDLAADIKENGLIHDIVLDEQGRVVDGRNRLEGCRRAGVEPRFTVLDGEDAVLFVMRVNLARRNLTQGQRAMLAVIADWDEQDRPKLGHSHRVVARCAGVPHNRIDEAVIIRKHADDLVSDVAAGLKPLSVAYEEAKKRKEEAESREAQLAGLKSRHPDLAVKVQESEMTLDEALAVARVRDDKARQEEFEERQRVERLKGAFDTILNRLDYGQMDPVEWAREWANAAPDDGAEAANFSAERARRAAETLLRYAEIKEAKSNA